MDKDYNIVAVGSAPGVAAVARESAKNKEKVSLGERLAGHQNARPQ